VTILKVGFRALFILSFALLILTAVLSLLVGQVEVSIRDVFSIIFDDSSESEFETLVFLEIRVPRVLMAIIIGAALALAGLAVQASFANPVIDASFVGISNSAGVGAMLFGLLSPNIVILYLGAVLFAGISSLFLARSRMENDRFVLFGFAYGIGSLGVLALLSSSPSLNLGRSVTNWLFGSLALVQQSHLFAAALVAISCVVLYSLSDKLDQAFLGRDKALSLGLNHAKYRLIWLLIASVLVALTVTLYGVIAFVGLIVPQILRTFGVASHRHLVLLSPTVGGTFLLMSDTFSRTLFGSFEMPVSFLLLLIGSMLLILSLVRSSQV
jgi:iron complex transport system permease protein